MALAHGIELLPLRPDVGYWLHDYPVPQVEMEHSFPLITKEFTVEGVGILTIDGGVQLKAFQEIFEEEGDIKTIRDLVLLSRPDDRALFWRVPMDHWSIPGLTPSPTSTAGSNHSPAIPEGRPVGCSISERLLPRNRPIPPRNWSGPGSVMPSIPPGRPPHVVVSDRLKPPPLSPQVGGVMLSGTARVGQGGTARVDLESAGFSLVLNGQNARLSPEAHRKFVTALYAVYFDPQDPGISIDPIAPGVDKHLVRYIGRVINSDLGRVMREADYAMKRWAVGTERPDIPGFQDIDTLSSHLGLRRVGASRRLWLVPADMRFKEGGGLLLFDSGRITVQTEYVFQNQGAKAEPADQAFADFFTANYSSIAAKYPVFEELFEYAKLVSLARYLKENDVPLLWYLLANKDLVLTEDSPGTVDALARRSAHHHGLYLEGGVDLKVPGQYIHDDVVANALAQAHARSFPPNRHGPITRENPGDNSNTFDPPQAGPFSLDIGRQSYSVVPQHSLTSGRDRRGLRYQTDLALKTGHQPGLELVRYFDPRRTEGGEFGGGWRLLIPYRIVPAGDSTRAFLNVTIPSQMTLKDLLAGEDEILTFNENRYGIAGYVPERTETSQVIGLFLMSDASYRLADKLGNEFWFDPAGYLTDMVFSKDYHLRIRYLDSLTDAVEESPYRIAPADEQRLEFRGVQLPQRMRVTDLIHGNDEVLQFDQDGWLVGYVPVDPATSRFQILALMSDLSYRLLDQHAYEAGFNATGVLSTINCPPDLRLVESISLGDQQVTFRYTVDHAGRYVVASAHLAAANPGDPPLCVARYDHDSRGRLARVQRMPSPGADARLIQN